VAQLSEELAQRAAEIAEQVRAQDFPTLLRCGRCQAARYCSRECQKQDWPSHKSVCARLSGGKGQAVSTKK
jgi:uncharacterized C2H2 Zn-finger protein